MPSNTKKLATVFSIFFVAVLASALFSEADAQPRWQWIKTGTGPTFEDARAMDMGPDGDLFIQGTFYDSVFFDAEKLESLGNYDVFTAQYAPNGNLRRSDGYGSIYSDDARSIAVDRTGNMYICGYFNEAMQLKTEILDGLGDAFSDDIFVAKIDKLGVVQWAKVFGSAEEDDDLSYVAVDSVGNVYLTGSFSGSAEFGTKTVTSNGKMDVYIAKISSAGDPIWVKSFGGGANDIARSIAVSPNGDRIYLAGTFIGAVDFGKDEITSFDGKQDIFIQAYDANGTVQFSQRIGYNGDDNDVYITTDKDGKLILTGGFYGQTTFFGMQIRANGEFFADMYLSRVSKSGAVDFVNKFGGPYNEVGLAVAVDSRGAFYTTGYFDSTATFAGTVVNSLGGRDIFIARFFSNGDFEWVRTAGGPHDDEGHGIVVNNTGIPYISGFFDTEAWFEDKKVEGDLVDAFVAALECGPDTRLNPETSPITICEGVDSLIIVRGGYPVYTWVVDGSTYPTPIDNRINLNALTVGTHTVYVRITDFYACTLNSDTVTVVVTEGLQKPVITKLGNDLSCDVVGVMYQWYLEGQPIAGATNQFVTITGEGLYRVKISDANGCYRWSDTFLVGQTSVEDNVFAGGGKVYPNPFTNQVVIAGCEGASVTITNALGAVVAVADVVSASQQIQVPGAPGVYAITVASDRTTSTILVVKH